MIEEHKIVKTESVPIREVMPNEERDFTPWLEKNLHLLKMGLEPDERERIVYGHLEIDLLAKSSNGDLVVIENQYGKSDNNHLAKTLIYYTGIEAKIDIWIAEEFREYHKEVILELNKSGAYNIYLIKVSAKKIIEDLETPRYIIDFDVIIAPDIELREFGKIRQLTEKEVLYKRFWHGLLEKTNTKTKLFSGRSRSIGNYLSAPSSISEVRYIYDTTKDSARMELYIDTKVKETNKSIFDNIVAHKDEIEERFGAELNWDRMEHAKASRIRYIITDRDWTDESKWDELHEEMSDKMVKFEEAIRDYIK